MAAINCKQAVFGGYKPTQEASEVTHVVLTKAEYDAMVAANTKQLTEIATLNNWLSSYKVDVRRLEAEVEAKKQAISVGQYETYLEKRKAQVATAKASALAKHNAGLQRIMRERANSARRLPKAKENSGYMLVRSEQAEFVHHYGQGKKAETVKIAVWRTTLDTYLDATLQYKGVADQIAEDLKNEELWQAMGVVAVDMDYFDGRENANLPEVNTAFRQRLTRNLRTMRWEYTFWTTRAIKVPVTMIPK